MAGLGDHRGALPAEAPVGRVREGDLREELPEDLVRLGLARRSLGNEEEEVLDGHGVELEDLAGRLPRGEGILVRGALHRAPILREEPPDAHPLVELEERVVGRVDLLEDPEAREAQVRRLGAILRHVLEGLEGRRGASGREDLEGPEADAARGAAAEDEAARGAVAQDARARGRGKNITL